jgi:hypothetical protein
VVGHVDLCCRIYIYVYHIPRDPIKSCYSPFQTLLSQLGFLSLARPKFRLSFERNFEEVRDLNFNKRYKKDSDRTRSTSSSPSNYYQLQDSKQIDLAMPTSSRSTASSSETGSDREDFSDWASSLHGARRTQSLFDADTVLDTPEECLEYDERVHGYNVQKEGERMGLDDYGRIRLINYIRREVSEVSSFRGRNDR